MTRQQLRRAADVLRSADALVIAAGAGMGVDSGLPDFRGTEGFWKAYPAYAKLGLDFASMANPQWFARDPEFAWGFYGHRLGLYRATNPHPGFELLRTWAARMRHGAFVFTSNVDGQFQKAGFPEERILEVHGSIHFVQCLGGCQGITPATPYTVEVDPETFRARPPLPSCKACGKLVRPNILMFGDWGWDSARTEAQEERLSQWLDALGPTAKLAIVECGAGTAIPSVRHFSERMAAAHKGTLIRVNVREPEVPAGHIGLPMKALEALRGIAEEMN
jgi:NAD-dependent SIR2 family protein deacetylase